jgi:hypothetical protein
MKWIIVFTIIIFLLTGCATTAYYTNPNSAGYYEQGLGGLCEKCGRQFVFSGYQLDTLENITCLYCGHAQNIQMAANRYTYEAQRQQTASNTRLFMGVTNAIQESNRKAAENRQKASENYRRALQSMERKDYGIYDEYGDKVGTLKEE